MSICGRIEDLEYQLEKLKASSECVALCWMEPNGLCSGCGRSLEDINAFGKEALSLMRKIEDLKK